MTCIQEVAECDYDGLAALASSQPVAEVMLWALVEHRRPVVVVGLHGFPVTLF